MAKGTGTKKTKNRTNKSGTKIDIVKHKDRRVNIPTEELRDFVADEERSPKTVLYPRDPSLDPQLVWKGKDEQDSKPLGVPAVPIYIQEKIHPQAIIEDLRDAARQAAMEPEGEPQINLFSDFNGLPKEFDKRVDFYHWDQNWSNRMILGDSLMVMTSLVEKEGLKGKVQMIYIDPPYGIKFGSNWQVSTRRRDVRDGKAEDVNREPEVVKAFRDTWQKGIHSYLAYLRDRFSASHGLLSESGSIFVQIGDENVHLVRSLLDEVFGSKNFVSDITFATTGGQSSRYIASVSDHLLWYAKNIDTLKYRQLYQTKGIREGGGWAHSSAELEDGSRVRPGVEEIKRLIEAGRNIRPYSQDALSSQGASSTPDQDWLIFQGKKYHPGANAHWKTKTHPNMGRLILAGRVEASTNSIRYVRFLDDFPVQPLTNSWTDTNQAGYVEDKIYVVQTFTRMVERCVLMTTDPGDLVFDPTCGSGTTAYVAEQWGRRWITADTSRVSLALARTRLMAARFPYYLLADSPEGIQKAAEVNRAIPAEAKTEGDVKKGFVYKRVPHITLKSIANNDEIDVIHERWQEKLERLRAELNKQLKQKWEEWQVPRLADPQWAAKTKTLHNEWWSARRERQNEIDAAINRDADTELLYDQPYEDLRRVRVAGPFTVESLSPHRVIGADNKDAAKTEAASEDRGDSNFVQTILENLKKAGVQNTVKNERLKFDRLESYSGVFIQASGEYSEKSKPKRVAVSIGPEYGTVSPELVKEAAKEAVQGVGFDLLIVCGFAFDPYISEEAKRYGRLTVLTARMNPDLAMGNELLKKTGAGNLFMVFGEPDIDIKKQKDGSLTVAIKGVDVYDPTTGQIRTSSTDDIACWFLDTNYNGESFFVRHAYFTGADEPYEKLKKALRAEVDEAAWSSLYSTVSRPFPPPAPNGKGQPKIAVKVINHYGDEVMKVYSV